MAAGIAAAPRAVDNRAGKLAADRREAGRLGGGRSRKDCLIPYLLYYHSILSPNRNYCRISKNWSLTVALLLRLNLRTCPHHHRRRLWRLSCLSACRRRPWCLSCWNAVLLPQAAGPGDSSG